MDFALVFREVIDFFVRFCSVELVFGGKHFTIGSLFIFIGIASLIIVFIKGMGD